MGDPFGIGPEIIAKALSKKSIRSLGDFVIIGDKNVYDNYCSKNHKNCNFVDLKNFPKKYWNPGSINKYSGKAAFEYLNRSVELLKNNEISALVTAPVCKESVILQDRSFTGHTEFLANSFNVKKVGMLFVGGKYKTIIVTRHIPLSKVAGAINKTEVYDTIALTDNALRSQFKIKKPRLAICGLNPHAGENGKIGDEEKRFIAPAIKKAQSKGIDAIGPFAADTLFSSNLLANADAVVAMYHDQGLIPIKTLYFNKLVNMTVGLPFIRTSPAHGTAFDIAGQGIADPSSMCEAIKLAAQLI